MAMVALNGVKKPEIQKVKGAVRRRVLMSSQAILVIDPGAHGAIAVLAESGELGLRSSGDQAVRGGRRSTSFKPGKPGGPGHPKKKAEEKATAIAKKATADVKAAAKECTEDAIKTLKSVMKDEFETGRCSSWSGHRNSRSRLGQAYAAVRSERESVRSNDGRRAKGDARRYGCG